MVVAASSSYFRPRLLLTFVAQYSDQSQAQIPILEAQYVHQPN